MSPSVLLDLKPLRADRPDKLAILTLSRPEASNAFHAGTLREIMAHLKTVAGLGEACRALLLRGEGKHFSAGADLEWMKASAKLTEAQNLEEAKHLAETFVELYRLPVPTFAYVHGACYGGATGLVAACDWAVAEENARFCLSEVRVGVVAAVILPFLAQKISAGHLRRFVLQGRVFTGTEALAAGLVQRVTSAADADRVLRDELEQVLAGSPAAQRVFKQLHQKVVEAVFDDFDAQKIHMEATIAKMRASASGQEGMASFFEKKTPSWVIKLDDKISLS
jgi:methylglutaconyl-CoA hydratase